MKDLQMISTKELRDNLSKILERVAIGGQTYVVSKFGKKKAMISPIKKEVAKKLKKKSKDLRRLAAYGRWKDRRDMRDSAAWVVDLRRKQSFRIRDES